MGQISSNLSATRLISFVCIWLEVGAKPCRFRCAKRTDESQPDPNQDYRRVLRLKR